MAHDGHADTDDRARGRHARGPREMPKEGWRDVLLRVREQVGKDRISLVAAGVAFYALLALFPLMAAVIAVYGLVFDPSDVQAQVSGLSEVLPQAVRTIVDNQLNKLASGSSATLGLAFAGSLVLTLWSSTKGVKSLMSALNAVYDEDEDRGLIAQNLQALAMTAGAILLLVLSVAAIVVLPAVLSVAGFGSGIEQMARLLRWPLLAAAGIGGLAALYRYGPSRRRPQWRWVLVGAAVAAVLWLLGSWLFSLYVSNFGSYNETYGALGGVVVLLMWLFVSSFVVLIGAELGAELEHQTAADSTGAGLPMGSRGAHVADTVGRRP